MPSGLGKRINKMNKEEILEKSRKENVGHDENELKSVYKGFYFGAFVALILGSILTMITGFVTNNWKLAIPFQAISLSVGATTFIYKAIKLKQKHEIFLAFFFTLCDLALIVLYIVSLIS